MVTGSNKVPDFRRLPPPTRPLMFPQASSLMMAIECFPDMRLFSPLQAGYFAAWILLIKLFLRPSFDFLQVEINSSTYHNGGERPQHLSRCHGKCCQSLE